MTTPRTHIGAPSLRAATQLPQLHSAGSAAQRLRAHREAAALLDTIAGYPRFEDDAGSDLEDAVRRFQESAGIPPSGTPDAATLEALRGEAGRIEAARTGHASPPGPDDPNADAWPLTGSGIEASARAAASRSAEAIDTHAARLRHQLAIPEQRTTRYRGQVDGWVASSEGFARRIGLTASGELLVTRSIRSIANTPDMAANIDRSLDRAERKYGRIDRALVLAIAARETRGRAFEGLRGSVNAFFAGGLDFLADEMTDADLFDPAEISRWVVEAPARNESGNAVRPVTLPRAHQIRAYAGTIEARQRRFEAEVRARFGDAADELLEDLTPEARRIWIQITFGGPFGAEYRGERANYGHTFGVRTALGRLVESSQRLEFPLDLNRIRDPDPFLERFDRIRRALVTAAEAELFDRIMTNRLNLPTLPRIAR